MEQIAATEYEWLYALKLLQEGEIEESDVDVELHSSDEGQDLNPGCCIIFT